MIETLKKLSALVDRRSRTHLSLLFLPMLVVAMLEMVGIALILPVIETLLPDGGEGPALGFLDSYLPLPGGEEKVFWVMALFAAFFFFKNLLYIVLIYVINRVLLLKAGHFIARMFVVYLSRPLTFHVGRNSAEILRDLVHGSSHAFEAIRQILLMALDLLIMVAAFGLLVTVHPTMTLSVAALLLVVAVCFHLITGPIFRTWGERAREAEGQVIKWISQSLNAIRDVKLFHAYTYLGREVEKHALERAAALSKAETTIHIPRQIFEVMIIICLLGVALTLHQQGQTSNEIIATMGLFGMAAMRLVPSLARFLSNRSSLNQRLAYVDTLHEDMTDAYGDADWNVGQGGDVMIRFERDINLNEVSYAYGSDPRHALEDVDMVIRKGESVGFVGPSGAGKTTLIDIVLGLLQPQSGHVLVDGADIVETLEGWQKRLGYVPQTIHLLDDTLRRNIAFGIEDDAIDDMRVMEAIEMAGLGEVMKNQPDGLDSMLGEFGARLSGGQRQRVAIARALYRDPEVLVFDEATSALDNETEQEIARAIDTLAGDKTVLIIAHRLSTVRNCDRLVFMQDGKIADIGRFEDLLANNAAFHQFARAGDGPSAEDARQESGE